MAKKKEAKVETIKVKANEEVIKVQVRETESVYGKVWAYFKQSGSIVLARATALAGVLVGGISMVDWTSVLGSAQNITGMSWKQGLALGTTFFLQGLSAEIVRRRGTRELADGRLVP